MSSTVVNGITTKIKPFDPESHAVFDKAKFKAIEYFDKKNWSAVVNPDIHAVDLIVTKDNGSQFYCEVEVKNNWKGASFPFRDIQILAKKKKHFILDKPSIMMMFNYEWTHILLLRDKDILDCPLVEVSNKYNPSGEYFFVVPVKKAAFVKL